MTRALEKINLRFNEMGVLDVAEFSSGKITVPFFLKNLESNVSGTGSALLLTPPHRQAPTERTAFMARERLESAHDTKFANYVGALSCEGSRGQLWKIHFSFLRKNLT